MPNVSFQGDLIEFPDTMSGDEVSDVLGAMWASTQAVAEFAATLVSGTAGDVVGGFVGLTDAINAEGEPGAGAKKVREIQSFMTYRPRTRAGQIAMQSIGEDITRLSEATGLNHMSGYWRDRVVPALQEQAGPIAGSVLAAGGLAAITALGELSPAGRAIPKRQLGAVGDLSKLNQKGDIDFDFPITHGSLDPDFTGEIVKGGPFNVFDGVFGSPGLESEFGGVKQITFFPRKDKVMGEGDIDVDFDSAEAFLKKEFPDADDDNIEGLFDVIMSDRDVFNMPENPLERHGFDDLGEASFEGQRLRGKFAQEQDFDAVAVSDEFGTSFLIPHGTKAIIQP